jgi:hypothetical protein
LREQPTISSIRSVVDPAPIVYEDFNTCPMQIVTITNLTQEVQERGIGFESKRIGQSSSYWLAYAKDVDIAKDSKIHLLLQVSVSDIKEDWNGAIEFFSDVLQGDTLTRKHVRRPIYIRRNGA